MGYPHFGAHSFTFILDTMKCSLQCILATTIVPIAFAQFFDLQVPKDLAVDVDSDSLDFFISFDGNAEEDGFISSAGDDSSGI